MSALDALIEVPLGDAEIIRAALNSAYHHSTVVDLAEGYRRLTPQPRPSNLTKSLQNALTLLITYIENPIEEEEDGPPDPPE